MECGSNRARDAEGWRFLLRTRMLFDGCARTVDSPMCLLVGGWTQGNVSHHCGAVRGRSMQ